MEVHMLTIDNGDSEDNAREVHIMFRRLDNKLACFVQTVGKIYVNVDFIYCLEIHHSKKRGYQLRAWTDTENDDCFILGEFKSAAEAEDFTKWLMARLSLVKEADGDIASLEFQAWRIEKWREKHGLRFDKVSLVKPLF